MGHVRFLRDKYVAQRIPCIVGILNAPHHIGEATLGKWFAKTGRRSEIFLATKFGALDFSDPERSAKHLPNSMPSYIAERLEASLKALQTDYIDLYYQHRVDPRVPIEVVVQTLKPFVESGKIRWIGLSECSKETLLRAKSVPGIGEKVIAAQMEFSPFELTIEKNGFAKAAEDHGVAVVAYSPLSRGLVSGKSVMTPSPLFTPVLTHIKCTHHPTISRKETSERCCHDSSLRTSPRTLRLLPN